MKYTKQMLEPIIKECNNYSQLLKRLNLQFTGGNNSYIRKVIKKLNIDTTHFTGKRSNKGKKFPPKYPITDYFSNKRHINSNHLKLRLIKEGYFEQKCYMCNLKEWYNKQIPLELHHIDNNHNNNNQNNLILLCPNCHALTHKLDRDYHIANHKNNIKTKEKIRKSQPRLHLRKTKRPPYNELIEDIKQHGYCAIGRKYGVSDNAIRKWVKFYEKTTQTSPN